MALIEQSIGALLPEVAIVLWQQQGLQIRRIVDRMRPGIRSQKLEVVREALLQIQIHRVVLRIAVGHLGVDRSERRNSTWRPQRAGDESVESSRRKSRECLHEEVVRRRRAEEVGCCGLYHSSARPLRDKS